jgi:UDP-N-acetylglucosamine 1-carboxyvinyltransferase
MDRLIIEGGNRLSGKVIAAGAKNAALPLMAACLLTDENVKISNIPHLSDITTMANLLVHMGVELIVESFKEHEDFHSGRVLNLCAKDVIDFKAPYEIVSKMRASVIVLGGLVARFGKAEISLPGGCAIGARPIDYHLHALEKMGAKIDLEDGYVKVTTENGLKGAVINFPTVSVGATENILIAATLAKGKTVLNNAAQEPEVCDLAYMLNSMGAKISGIGTATMTIEGVEKLHGTNYSVIADRIEAGTYLACGLITGGDVEVAGIDHKIMESTLQVFEKMGAEIIRNKNSVRLIAGKILKPIALKTEPHPGFPTDMQAQITALMCVAEGNSIMEENIFENRFMHVPELQRMGAKMTIEGKKLSIDGIKNFKSAEVMATDLRASVCLILAALKANGKTILNRVYHLDRGYERIEEKLNSLGAVVYRTRT